MDELQYLMDGKPCSARQLIRWASDLDDEYRDNWLKSTSAAANVLREHGSTVGNNPDYKPAEKANV